MEGSNGTAFHDVLTQTTAFHRSTNASLHSSRLSIPAATKLEELPIPSAPFLQVFDAALGILL
jgi:hypothetical protein